MIWTHGRLGGAGGLWSYSNTSRQQEGTLDWRYEDHGHHRHCDGVEVGDPQTGSTITDARLATDPRTSIHPQDVKGSQAHDRNMRRISEAQELDKKIIGKNLPSEAANFFPHRLEGPDDRLSPPVAWLDRLKYLSRKKVPTPKAGDLSFGLGEKDLRENALLLEQHGYEVGALIAGQVGITVSHGSEFWNWEDLESILGGHPRLKFLGTMIHQGMGYHFTKELTEDQRLLELEAQLRYGNHKSARAQGEKVSNLLARNVRHGFAIPLPADLVRRIKGATVQPCGIVKQHSLEADGSRKLKERLTHNLSHLLTMEDASANSRIDMSQYPEMVYGWCLVRIIHYIVCLRLENPGVKFLYRKLIFLMPLSGSAIPPKQQRRQSGK